MNPSRPLEARERELIEVLLGAAGAAGGRYLGQLETAEAQGACGCGCPSINLTVNGRVADGNPRPLVMADGVAPGGTAVSIILWVRGGKLSGLEVHAWDESSHVGLPLLESLDNVHTTPVESE